MFEDYWVRLSTRGEDKTQYIGTDENWDTAERILEEVAQANELNYRPGPGEAAFYGPKLDFMFKDAIGREWQLATIQCDFNLPERFDLSFTNEKGEQERPVVIHRAISGSLERFMGVMIEHFAGVFPVWLAPIQVAIVPVRAELHSDAAHALKNILQDASVRAEMYGDNNSLGKRIHAAKSMKVPYVVVLGDKEVESGNYTVELRDGSKIELNQQDLLARLQTEIKERS